PRLVILAAAGVSMLMAIDARAQTSNRSFFYPGSNCQTVNQTPSIVFDELGVQNQSAGVLYNQYVVICPLPYLNDVNDSPNPLISGAGAYIEVWGNQSAVWCDLFEMNPSASSASLVASGSQCTGQNAHQYNQCPVYMSPTSNWQYRGTFLTIACVMNDVSD